MGQLRDAIHALIWAEYHFRYGKQAYQRIPEQYYVEALEELYEVATGHKDLPSAFKALNQYTDTPEPIASLPKPQLKPEGFFK